MTQRLGVHDHPTTLLSRHVTSLPQPSPTSSPYPYHHRPAPSPPLPASHTPPPPAPPRSAPAPPPLTRRSLVMQPTAHQSNSTLLPPSPPLPSPAPSPPRPSSPPTHPPQLGDAADGAPVELDAAADAVHPGAEHHRVGLLERHVVARPVVRQVEVVGGGRPLGRHRVDALHARAHAERRAQPAHLQLRAADRGRHRRSRTRAKKKTRLILTVFKHPTGEYIED